MDGIIDSLDSGFSKLWQIVKDKEAWDPAVHGVKKGQTLLSEGTTRHLPKEDT